MRITESRLRRIIKETMTEMSHDALGHFARPDEYAGSRGTNAYASKPENRKRAQACIDMVKDGGTRELFKMCIEICNERPDMAQRCLQLCQAIICDGLAGMNSCCHCLDEICADEVCCKICVSHCGC